MTASLGKVSLVGDDGLKLGAWRASPAGPSRGAIQIAHGMAEHSARYLRLASVLSEAGWTVWAQDHRGHGQSASAHGLGEFGPRGFAGVVSDMASLTRLARAESDDGPFVLLGHSMGSFASQLFILDHARLIDGMALSGTAACDLLLGTMAEQGGASGLEAFNEAFEPARTAFDWLSRDREEVDAYVSDPLCGFALSDDSMASLFAAVAGASTDARLSAAAHGLPVLVMSGEDDPVVGPEQAFAQELVNRYRAAAMGPVVHRIYPGARHELFNETCRDAVTGDLIAWLAGVPRRRVA